ncbi:hypothetical protein SAMN04488096_11018 [Mesonia phycicola]|uniref:Uncharacterized protein n=1 Tax=Mesonia phycicola TaxID=579105 RepID=A0A1M6HA35_9FLAO|nr:hypothetical protein [Mesonia phycicola]SHJ19092.1 hypothetical protein SAMN04488096_11018 [Mesonia phycicola]
MINLLLFKKSIKYLFFCLLITSCKSNFDLTEVKFGETNVNVIIPEKTEKNDYQLGDDKIRSSRSKEILTVNKVELQNQTKDTSFYNYVSFKYNEKNIITEYTLAYYTLKEEPKIVYNLLKDKIGLPSFRHYTTNYDKEHQNYDAVIWEDKQNNKLYRLRYHLWEEEGLRELRLTVLINSESNIEDPVYSGQPFYFWKDYINTRNRLGNNNYTYQEFIKSEGSYSFFSE